MSLRWNHARRAFSILLLTALTTGCSLKKYAINKIGDALAEGNSVYETDEDVTLVGEALPFGLKFTESLLQESPKHRGLLLTAARGFVLYSYAYVDYEAEVAADEDLDRARALRLRARKLYLRAFGYGVRGLERSHPGFASLLASDPAAAARLISNKKKKHQDLPLLYWTAAALGLSISVSRNDAAMLARLPEVEVLLDRALELDSDWDEGTLHEFKVVFAGAKPGRPDYAAIRRDYEAALALSQGKRAGLYLAYAETVAVPRQDSKEFRALIRKALAVDPDEHKEVRLVNLLAHRRARWLLERVDDLILDSGEVDSEKEEIP